jgi:antitoxin ParD1/3/4
MNVSLTPKLKKYVEKRVKSGDYGSASEVVRDGLRLLEERERKLAYLKQEVGKAWDSVEAGRTVRVSLADMKKRLRSNLSRRKKIRA